MNGVPEEVIRVWVRNKAAAESAVPVVAFGCRCGNRWEPSNVEWLKPSRFSVLFLHFQRMASKRGRGRRVSRINMGDLSAVDIHP